MDNSKKAIGVFDSGLGGISVLRDLKKLMPNEDFIYFGEGIRTQAFDPSKLFLKFFYP